TKIKNGLDWLHHGVVGALTPRCREMTRLISAEREGSHSWFTRLRMRWHLRVCVWCRRYRDQVGFLGMVCRMFAEESAAHGEAHLSDEAKERLKQALKHHGHE
ncbi:MAG: hypothetical protein ACRDBP_04145, partial [Luteolibacter sp.]